MSVALSLVGTGVGTVIDNTIKVIVFTGGSQFQRFGDIVRQIRSRATVEEPIR